MEIDQANSNLHYSLLLHQSIIPIFPDYATILHHNNFTAPSLPVYKFAISKTGLTLF